MTGESIFSRGNDRKVKRLPAMTGTVDHHIPGLPEVSKMDGSRTSPATVTVEDIDLGSSELPSIPGYDILSVLGQGGMGVVYKARQVGLNRLVAVKTILEGAHTGPTDLARFRAEAEAVAQLQHPNIVQIYEIGELRDRPFYSMEYVDGGSLADRLGGRAMPPRQAAHLLEAVAQAVQCAHERSIVHRDLKPANILLQPMNSNRERRSSGPFAGVKTPDSHDSDLDRMGSMSLIGLGIPKITDFGLAKRFTASAANLTAAGCVVGTPNYMAPEQILGTTNDIGATTDIYALGVILYEMLTGRLPFPVDNAMDLMHRAARNDLVPPQTIQPDLPTDLVTICLKCLRKDPHDRYPTAQALAKDLRRFLNGMPILARPRNPMQRAIASLKQEPWILLLCLLLLCSAAVLFVTRSAVDSIIVLTGALALSGLLWQWRRAESERRSAVEQRMQAREARREGDRLRLAAENARREALAQAQKAAHALRESESHLYSLRIALAEREWQANNVLRVENILCSCAVHLRSWEWQYLKRLLHTELLTFTGHRDWVRDIAFHPLGKEIASAGGSDQIVRIWEAASGKEIRSLTGHTGCVRAVAYSNDGRRMATAGDDQTIRVYDAQTGASVAVLSGHDEEVLSIAFSSDGQRLVSASTDCTVRLWDAAVAQEIGMIRMRHQSAGPAMSQYAVPPFDVVFSPDSQRIAIAGKDRCISVYDVTTGREALVLEGHTDAVTGLAFSPTGAYLASAGGYDATCRIWDAATGQELRILRGHIDAVWHAAFHPDGAHVATAGGDGTVRVWNARSGSLLFTLRGHTKSVASVAFSPDGQLLASACTDGTVKIWTALTPQEAVPFGVHAGVECVAWRADGNQLATGGAGGELKLWDTVTRQVTTASEGNPDRPAHEGCTIALAYSPDGKRLASGGSDGLVKIWDSITAVPITTLAGHARPVSSVGWGESSQPAISVRSLSVEHSASPTSASLDGTAKIWDLQSNQSQLTFRGHMGQLVAMANHPQTHIAVTASVDPLRPHLEVKFWKSDTGDEVRTFLIPRHPEETAIVCFSPNGLRLATASHGYCAKIWEAHTGRELCSLVGHGGPIISLAFSPDGQRIATASRDQTLKIWDVATGQEVLTIREYAADILQVAFSPNGRQLVTIHRDGTIRVW